MNNQFDRCFFLLDVFEVERIRPLTSVNFDVGKSEVVVDEFLSISCVLAS